MNQGIKVVQVNIYKTLLNQSKLIIVVNKKCVVKITFESFIIHLGSKII